MQRGTLYFRTRRPCSFCSWRRSSIPCNVNLRIVGLFVKPMSDHSLILLDRDG